jgi:hypothetical protein
MRFLSLLSTAGLLAQAACTPIAARESQNAGYLAAIFKGDEPSVFFYIASAQNPTTFQALNGGKPYLVPTGGTGGARDPFILKANNPSDAKVRASSYVERTSKLNHTAILCPRNRSRHRQDKLGRSTNPWISKHLHLALGGWRVLVYLQTGRVDAQHRRLCKTIPHLSRYN